jgi:hypothetical protein
MYLIRKRGKKNSAHIWTGEDTACRMYSTGGMLKDRFELRDEPGEHRICTMCVSVTARAPARAPARTGGGDL